MIFGFIVGGLLGGIVFAGVETTLANKVSPKIRNIISWICTIITYGAVRALIQ